MAFRRRDCGAWGETLPGGFDNVPGGMSYGFVGALRVRTDADTGLLYMRQRWYDPTLQRFISRDPIGLRGGANLYEYAGGNPSKMVDPLGLVIIPAAVILHSAKNYAQLKARELKSQFYKKKILVQPPKGKPKDGSYRCEVLYDKFQHCFVSCEISQRYGSIVSFLIGYGHELQAGISPTSTMDPLDIRANLIGAVLGGVETRVDCFNECSKHYPITYSWPDYPDPTPDDSGFPPPAEDILPEILMPPGV